MATAIDAIRTQLDIVGRMREIASQGASKHLSEQQRKALQAELKSMFEEFNRLTNETEYDGKKILDGSAALATVMLGLNPSSAVNLYTPNLTASRTFKKLAGTGVFNDRTTLGVGSTPSGVKSGDLDNDGDEDLVSVDGSGTVSVMLNNGFGVYGARMTAVVGAATYSIALDDLDADGILDIVSADQGDNTVSVSYGNGDGRFTSRVTMSASGAPRSIHTADINGDGILDILTVGASAATAQNFASGISEISYFNMIGAGTREITELTMTTAGGAGLPEITEFDFDPTSYREITDVTLPAVGGVQEQTRYTFNGGGSAVAEITEITVTDIPAHSSFETREMGFGDGSSINSGDYFTLDTGGFSGNHYYVWFNVDAGGGDPSIGGLTGIEVAVSSGDSASDVADAVEAALASDAPGEFNVTDGGGGVLTIANSSYAWAEDTITSNSSAANISLYTQGYYELFDVTHGFTFNTINGDQDYYVWLQIDGTTLDPSLAGTGIQVSVASTDSAADVASAIAGAINSALGGSPAAAVGDVVTLTNAVAGAVADGVGTTSSPGSNMPALLSTSVTQQGAPASGYVQSSYFTLNSPSTNYYVWLNIDGGGVDPAPGGTGVQVNINSAWTNDQVAAAVEAAIDAIGGTPFSASVSTNQVTVTNTAYGTATDGGAGDMGGAITPATLIQGVNRAYTGGEHFTLAAPSGSYYVWYQVDGAGADPTPGGTGIQVNIDGNYTATQVASATATAIDALAQFAASNVGGTVTITNAAGGSVTDVANGTVPVGFSRTVTQQGTTSSMANGDYFLLKSPSTNYYVWIDVANTGVDPTPGGTGIEVNVGWDNTDSQVATAVAAAIDALGDFAASAVGDTVTVTNAANGNVVDASDGNMGGTFSVNVTQQGVAGGGGDIAAGDYFNIHSTSGAYYVWFRVDGVGVDPTPGGTGIMVDILSGDTATQVATKVAAAIDATVPFIASSLGDVVTLTNASQGTATDATDGNVGGAFGVSVTTQGSDSALEPGDHFLLSSTTTDYYVWYSIGGTGSDPAVAGRTGIQVNINFGDSASTVATATAAAIDAQADFISSALGTAVTVTNATAGPTTDISNGTITGFVPTVTQQGGYNIDVTANTITLANHGFTTTQAVTLTTTGTLPNPLLTATTYYIIAVDANTLKLATSSANALSGTAIDITTVGTGTHTITPSGTVPVMHALLGNGNRTFSPYAMTALVGGTPTHITSGDLNRDGIIDLVARDSADNTISILIGNGDGTFQTRATRTVGVSALSHHDITKLADINGDKILDILTLDSSDDTLTILLGVGNGTFGSRVTIATGDSPYGLQVGDINNDGALDVMTADRGDSTLSLMIGNGDGTFRTRRTMTSGTNPSGLTLVDLDGDRVLDVVSSDESSSTLSIFKAKAVSVSAVGDLNVHSADASENLIAILQDVTEKLTSESSKLSALHDRLESAKSHNLLMSETLEEARDRTVGLDYAVEVAEFVRLQILENAQTAIAAQANLQLKLVLNLLRF